MTSPRARAPASRDKPFPKGCMSWSAPPPHAIWRLVQALRRKDLRMPDGSQKARPGGKSLRDLVFKGRNPDGVGHAEEGEEFAPRARIDLEARALINNYKAIQALVPDQAILP